MLGLVMSIDEKRGRRVVGGGECLFSRACGMYIDGYNLHLDKYNTYKVLVT